MCQAIDHSNSSFCMKFRRCAIFECLCTVIWPSSFLSLTAEEIPWMISCRMPETRVRREWNMYYWRARWNIERFHFPWSGWLSRTGSKPGDVARSRSTPERLWVRSARSIAPAVRVARDLDLAPSIGALWMSLLREERASSTLGNNLLTRHHRWTDSLTRCLMFI